MDDLDINRILSNMEKKFGTITMITAIGNPHLRHHMLSRYLYGKYERTPIQATVHRDDSTYVRNIGQTRSDVSYKQYLKINAVWHEKFDNEYSIQQRELKEKERAGQQKRLDKE